MPTNHRFDRKYHKTSSIILAGLGVAAVGFAGKHLLRRMPQMTSKFNEALKNLPKFDAESMANSKYYKGGFDPKMNKREASLILGVSPSAPKIKASAPRAARNLIKHLTKRAFCRSRMPIRKLCSLIIQIAVVHHIWQPRSTRPKTFWIMLNKPPTPCK